MADILIDLLDLRKQAVTERSHYYVAKTVERAIEEIAYLRRRMSELDEGRPTFRGRDDEKLR
jgi:hypothetical protein